MPEERPAAGRPGGVRVAGRNSRLSAALLASGGRGSVSAGATAATGGAGRAEERRQSPDSAAKEAVASVFNSQGQMRER